MNNIKIQITDGALKTALPCQFEGAGAVVSFDGIVRLLEDGKELAALKYEVYEPMTSRELEKLAKEIISEFGILAICAEHSQGKVNVGDCSMRVKIAGKHRKEAIAALDCFIDRLKKQVPIWKVPVWKNSE